MVKHTTSIGTFGSRLQAARIAKDLTQWQLAKRLKVDRVTLARWETDAQLPSPLARFRLAKLFGEELFAT